MHSDTLLYMGAYLGPGFKAGNYHTSLFDCSEGELFTSEHHGSQKGHFFNSSLIRLFTSCINNVYDLLF